MTSAIEKLKNIFTYDMVDIIFRHTKKRMKSFFYQNYNESCIESQRQWKSVKIPDIYWLIICVVANNTNTDHSFDMWHSNSYPLHCAIMGVNRLHHTFFKIRWKRHSKLTEKGRQGKTNWWYVDNVEMKSSPDIQTYWKIDNRGTTLYLQWPGFTQNIPSIPYSKKNW